MPHATVVYTQDDSVILGAHSEEEADSWLRVLSNAFRNARATSGSAGAGDGAAAAADMGTAALIFTYGTYLHDCIY